MNNIHYILNSTQSTTVVLGQNRLQLMYTLYNLFCHYHRHHENLVAYHQLGSNVTSSTVLQSTTGRSTNKDISLS